MKKTFGILFILTVIISNSFYSQSLDWNYDDCLTAIKNHPESYDKFKLESNKETGVYFINASCVNSNAIAHTFYFNKKDNLCYLVVISYLIEHINSLINLNNKNYVKLEEFKWKNYENDVFVEIVKTDNIFFMKIYK